MRQLFTWRFVAAVGSLVLLALFVNAVFADDDDVIEAVVEQTTPPERQIDLIVAVESFERSADFAVGDDGLTVGYLDAVLDQERVVRIAPGTPGEITCPNIRSSNRCVILADLLGEAVIWFAVLPRAARDTVVLPPIIDLQEGYAVFGNGWRVAYPPVIERDCDDEDIPSFSDFLRRFGPNSTTIVALETQQVSSVICGEEFIPPPTTTVPDPDALVGQILIVSTTVPLFDPDVQAPDL